MSLYAGKNSGNTNKVVHITSGIGQDITYLDNNIKTDTVLHSSMPYVTVVNTEQIAVSGIVNHPTFVFNSTTAGYFADPNYSYLFLFQFPDGHWNFSPEDCFFAEPNLSDNTLKGYGYIGTEPTVLFIVQFKFNVFKATDAKDISINNHDIVVDGISVLTTNPMYILSTPTPISSRYSVRQFGSLYLHTPLNSTSYSTGNIELTATSLKVDGYIDSTPYTLLNSIYGRPVMNVEYMSLTKADFNNSSNLYFDKVIGNDFSYLILMIEGIDNSRPDPYLNYTGASFYMNAVLSKNGFYQVILALTTAGLEKMLDVYHRESQVLTYPPGTLHINMYPPEGTLDTLNVKLIKMI